MTLTEQQMLDVMAFTDGELEGDDAERVRTLIASSPEAQELVVSIGALGDFVRSESRSRQSPSPSVRGRVDVADEVMRRVGPSEIERARLKRASRLRAGAVIVAITALAAGVLLYRRAQDESARARPSQTAPTALALGTTPSGVEVEHVDSPQSVSVFYIDDAKENRTQTAAPTTVVWIDDPSSTP